MGIEGGMGVLWFLILCMKIKSPRGRFSTYVQFILSFFVVDNAVVRSFPLLNAPAQICQCNVNHDQASARS
jgi:hypothetical protein